jgi:tRNA(fMet)-specific endonuclease VapC
VTPNARQISPRYILDTDTVTHQQLHRGPVPRRIAEHDPAEIATTVITMTEQLRGRLAEISRARDEQSLVVAYARLDRTRDYYCFAVIVPFDTASAAIFRLLVAQRLRVGTQDLRIAAITLAHDATLVTSNRRDFDRVPGLRVEDWNVV